MGDRLRKSADLWLLVLAVVAVAAGGWAWLSGVPVAADRLWALATLPVLAALVVDIVVSLRRGAFGLDILAAVSMSAALLIGETLAAGVVAVMYAGGRVLEGFAEVRARREMTALLARAPRVAMRRRDGAVVEIPLDEVEPGDSLVVPRGETVPADGRLVSGTALLDTSSLTGEAEPVRLSAGEAVLSGSANLGEALDMVAERRADESTFAAILRLVAEAEKSRAPMARMADRYALGFLAVTLALAGAAWGLSGDAVRAVAVLVIATPCPLILAVPVALIAGVSRAARAGVLVKGAAALEALGRIRVVILDKTGTLTLGSPRLISVAPEPGVTGDEVLRLAASLDQMTRHPVALALVDAARAARLPLETPEAVVEVPGEGLRGRVGGRAVVVGGLGFVRPGGESTGEAGEVLVGVAVEGRFVGSLTLNDPLRPETAGVLAGLRAHGIRRLLLATGDRQAVAEAVADDLDFDRVVWGMTPEAKLKLVAEERQHGPVLMAGDGVNDAPALASADLGLAMGARGAAAAAEAAGAVILVDRLEPLLAGIAIAAGARRIAGQSVAVGIGLSTLGMVAAAFGLIPPVAGAALQEVIDVAVILNALRALALPIPKAARADG